MKRLKDLAKQLCRVTTAVNSTCAGCILRRVISKGHCFLTGSRMYGTPREDSDWDICILLTSPADIDTLRRAADGQRSGSEVRNGWSFRFGEINLIVFQDHNFYHGWYSGTENLIAVRPVTKAQAIAELDRAVRREQDVAAREQRAEQRPPLSQRPATRDMVAREVIAQELDRPPQRRESYTFSYANSPTDWNVTGTVTGTITWPEIPPGYTTYVDNAQPPQQGNYTMGVDSGPQPATLAPNPFYMSRAVFEEFQRMTRIPPILREPYATPEQEAGGPNGPGEAPAAGADPAGGEVRDLRSEPPQAQAGHEPGDERAGGPRDSQGPAASQGPG